MNHRDSTSTFSRMLLFFRLSAGFVFAWMGRQIFWACYYAEHALVLLREGIARSIARLDPRVHLERLRIKEVTEGAIIKETKKFVVLVIYCNSEIPAFTKIFIETIEPSLFNLVVVSNCDLDQAGKAYILKHCCLLIERVNVGRDFGAYKDGISVVTERYRDIDRLVIANDSVYFLPNGIERLVADLDGENDFIGVSEVVDHHYHIGSFLISFGRSVLAHEAFSRFWSGYTPIGTRRWAIFRGEGRLTANLLKAGFRPHVLFSVENLRPFLYAQSDRELKELIPLLPIHSRQVLAEQDASRTGRTGTNDVDLADRIIDTIMARNQMHTGGALFRKYLGLPLVKRDIVFREVYSLDDISPIFSDVPPPLLAEIMADIRLRGCATELGFVEKLLYRHSAR